MILDADGETRTYVYVTIYCFAAPLSHTLKMHRASDKGWFITSRIEMDRL